MNEIGKRPTHPRVAHGVAESSGSRGRPPKAPGLPSQAETQLTTPARQAPAVSGWDGDTQEMDPLDD